MIRLSLVTFRVDASGIDRPATNFEVLTYLAGGTGQSPGLQMTLMFTERFAASGKSKVRSWET
jgi:hypothetical protein